MKMKTTLEVCRALKKLVINVAQNSGILLFMALFFMVTYVVYDVVIAFSPKILIEAFFILL